MLERDMAKKLNTVLPQILFVDIESNTELGIPDRFYSYRDVAGWMELKELSKRPKTKVKIPWRPGQLAWYAKYRSKSDCAYILCLTIIDSWYIISDIKKEYPVEELQKFYVGETSELTDHFYDLHNRLVCNYKS